MKNVYEIRKLVLAESVSEAIKLEAKADIVEIYITNHSRDIVLDNLHAKKKIGIKNE